MSTKTAAPLVRWQPGTAPVAVVMISLNEGHNMEAVLENLKGWAHEVFLVDSYSADETVDIALRHGVHVVQRRFRGFGDQWNFALRELPITAPWTMKLDPDERMTEALKRSLSDAVTEGRHHGFSFDRRLWFMGKALPIRQEILRVWRTGECRFTDVSVNEHPLVEGSTCKVSGFLEHHDSPDLHHWVEKQNRYSSMEAISYIRGDSLSASPRIFGSRQERRMWFKRHFMKIPFRYFIAYVINLIHVKAWSSGKAGIAWARLRVWVRRMKEDKVNEMKVTGREVSFPKSPKGQSHPKATQAD